MTKSNQDPDLLLAIGQLQGKMDSVIVFMASVEGTRKEHEERLGSLEGFRKWTMGITLGATTVITLLWALYSASPAAAGP